MKDTKAKITENINSTKRPVSAEDKIPLKEKFIYGAAEMFGGGQSTLLSLILLVFFTDIIGINATIAGTVILLSKGWDAFSDPLCGMISDNMRSKFGRRKPFMFIGGILIIPALAFLFAPIQNFSSDAAKIVFAMVAYIAYCTVSTISQVPYCSMSSDISSDYRERNSANTIKLGFDMISAGICYLIPSLAFEMLLAGEISQTTFYLIIVFGFGFIFSLPLMVAAFVVKERAPYPAERTKFEFKEWLKSFKIKSYKYHILMYIGAYLCMDIVSALAIFYVKNVLRGVMLFGKPISSLYVIAPMMVIAGLIIPVCYLIMQKKTKQFAFRCGLPIYIVGALMLSVYQTIWPSWLVPVFACMMGLGLGGAQMMPWLVFPDTIDVAELKLGYRPTGNFSGVMTFSRKLSTAVSIQLVSLVLGLAGYISSTVDEDVIQPNSVLIAIRVLLGISVTLLVSLAFYASIQYKVTNKKLERVRYFNNHSRNGTLDTLSTEETTERENLIAELAG
jgi:Na+/melibiose symporter-like transporter